MFDAKQIALILLFLVLIPIGLKHSPSNTAKIQAELICGEETDEPEAAARREACLDKRNEGSYKSYTLGAYILHLPASFVIKENSRVGWTDDIRIELTYPDAAPVNARKPPPSSDIIQVLIKNNYDCRQDLCGKYDFIRFQQNVLLEGTRTNLNITQIRQFDSLLTEYKVMHNGERLHVYAEGDVNMPTQWYYCGKSGKTLCHTIFNFDGNLWVELVFNRSLMADHATLRGLVRDWITDHSVKRVNTLLPEAKRKN